MPLFRPKTNPKTQNRIADGEKLLESISFEVHKFSDRPRPGRDDVLILCCFSEFGCEVVGAMYCVSAHRQEHGNPYTIVVGWHGRAYLYRHQADEFWELKAEHQWLRDRSLAFHFDSRNLRLAEEELRQYGRVVTSSELGRMAVENFCHECRHRWGAIKDVHDCPKCKSRHLARSLFADVQYYKPRAVRIPPPSPEKVRWAADQLGPNPVGVVARNRRTYGRNLPVRFYVELVRLLRSHGYSPVWLGEPQTTHPCPLPDVVDFSRRPECRDLETTLAVVGQLRFTAQFWTASTRLAAVMGTPYLLFESPDQIYNNGQEGYRLALCTFGQRKLVLCNYLRVAQNQGAALQLADRAVREMRVGDWQDVIGLVEDPNMVRALRQGMLPRLMF